MKTRNLLLMAVAAMASAACMEKETEVTPAGNEEIICEADAITAFCENEPDVRTSLSEGAVLWHNGDAIAVWNGTKAVEYVTDAQDGSASADFTTSDTGFEQVEDYLALYPYSDAAEFSAGKVKTVIPDVQTPVAGGFAKGTNVTVASGSADALEFRNVCGYVKFTVPEGMTDLTKVELSANSGESLAGEVEIAISSEPSAVVVEGNGKSSVVMEGTFEAGKSYYLAVLPKTLEGGFTMTLTRTEGTTTMNTTKAFTVTRSKAKPIGELYDGTWKVSLEGSAVPEGKSLMLTQTLENKDLFACLETLNAGKLNLRVLYENVYVSTEGGAYTDGSEVSFVTSSSKCDFDIAEAGVYRIVLNKATGGLTIYSPDTNPQNKTVSYNNTVDKVNPYTQEVTSLWMYGTFNGSVQDVNDCPLGQSGCQFDCKYRLTQSLADPYLFVYYNNGEELPRLEKVFQSWDNVKYKGGVNFYVSNIQNNVYAYGSTADAKRSSYTGAVECSLGEKVTAVAGQSDNRYALFLIPEGANYVEVDIQNLTVLFETR